MLWSEAAQSCSHNSAHTKALQVAVHPAAAAQWRGELEQLSLISRLKFSSCISLRTLTTSPAATRYINALFRAFSSSSSASSGALAGAFGKPRACKPLWQQQWHKSGQGFSEIRQHLQPHRRQQTQERMQGRLPCARTAACTTTLTPSNRLIWIHRQKRNT